MAPGVPQGRPSQPGPVRCEIPPSGYKVPMTEHSAELLPVLPLDDVVVLPHMTVTVAVQGEG